MQLPRENAHFMSVNAYGLYVAGRLKRAGLPQQAQSVLMITLAVKLAGRALEDADEPVQDALSERDATQSSAELIIQTGRASLAGRSPSANKEVPYLHLFPDGIDFYIAARLEERISRFELLLSRAQKHLPVDDSVRITLSDSLPPAIAAFSSALDTVRSARLTKSQAADTLTAARTAWFTAMERLYGELISLVGKKNANNFFPKP